MVLKTCVTRCRLPFFVFAWPLDLRSFPSLSDDVCEFTHALLNFIAAWTRASYFYFSFPEKYISVMSSTENVTFSASTSAKGPGYPVLHGKDVWCAGVINDKHFLKVDLGRLYISCPCWYPTCRSHGRLTSQSIVREATTRGPARPDPSALIKKFQHLSTNWT